MKPANKLKAYSKMKVTAWQVKTQIKWTNSETELVLIPKQKNISPNNTWVQFC